MKTAGTKLKTKDVSISYSHAGKNNQIYYLAKCLDLISTLQRYTSDHKVEVRSNLCQLGYN